MQSIQDQPLNQNEQTETAPTEQPAAPSITDLDGLSEFAFQGQKYTPDALVKIVNGYKSYSESAGKYAEREELDQHFEVDRARLLKDPSLADQFRQKYPQQYHWILDFLPTGQRQEPAQPTAAQSALPPEYLEKLQALEARVSHYDSQAQQAAIQKASAEIDRITEPLFKKFPMADPDAVFARVDVALGNKVVMTEKAWERYVRESHEQAQKRADQTQGALLKEQMEKGRRAQDVGPGGSTPGQAPQLPRTMSEAREAALKHAQSQ